MATVILDELTSRLLGLAGFHWFCDRSDASTGEYNISALSVEAAVNFEYQVVEEIIKTVRYPYCPYDYERSSFRMNDCILVGLLLTRVFVRRDSSGSEAKSRGYLPDGSIISRGTDPRSITISAFSSLKADTLDKAADGSV